MKCVLVLFGRLTGDTMVLVFEQAFLSLWVKLGVVPSVEKVVFELEEHPQGYEIDRLNSARHGIRSMAGRGRGRVLGLPAAWLTGG